MLTFLLIYLFTCISEKVKKFLNNLLMYILWEKRDAHVGNKWDSSGLWVGKRVRVPKVFTCLLYYSECMYVNMMHGREH